MKGIKIFACPTAEEFTQEICDYLKEEPGKINFVKFKNDNKLCSNTRNSKRKRCIHSTNLYATNKWKNNGITNNYRCSKKSISKEYKCSFTILSIFRSDKKDQPRIPITAKLMAQIIEAAGATRVITCDLHNPAIQAYFNNINCDRLTGEYVLEKYF